MATASNPLEEFLQSEVDEKALNALVGSLESQLASPTAKDSSHQISSNNPGKKLVNNAHVGGSATSAVVLDGQKAVITANPTRIVGPHSSSSLHNTNSSTGNHITSSASTTNSNHPSLNSLHLQGVNRINTGSPLPSQLTDLTNVPVAGRPSSTIGQPLLNNGNSLNSRPASAGPIQKTYSQLDSLHDGQVRAVIKQEMRGSVAPSPRQSIANTVPKSQSPIIVRTPNTGQQIQIMTTSATRVQAPNTQLKTLAPRIVGNPIRIGVNQQHTNIAPRPGTHHMMGRGPPLPPPHHDLTRGKVRSTITIPAGFQLPPNAVFIKNEHGQIVMVTPQSAGGTATSVAATSGQKIVIKPSMVQSVAGGGNMAVSRPGAATNLAVTHPSAAVSHSAASQPPSSNLVQNPASNSSSNAQTAQLENIKKCKNFLTTLIKLASSQPKDTVDNVRQLIQGLIDGHVEPEVFTHKLQIVLRSSPQPYLVPFLKKSLPQLRQCLCNGKMTIEGVQPPKAEIILQQSQSPTTPKMAPNRSIGVNRVVKASPHAMANVAAAHKDKRKFEALKEDDDINDVATMGGVNLSEESRHLASNSELLSSQMRSCKDEYFLNIGPLHKRISAIARKYDVLDVPPEVAHVISHAAQERLRTYIEKLSTIAEHRMEMYKQDQRVELSGDTKDRLKFLDELDKLERKRHEDVEREMLLRAAKSRSKQEDPEQLKLKQKAKELQQAEMEEVRQREANLTALAAIGPRKKRKVDGTPESTSAGESSWSSTPTTSQSSPASRSQGYRPRMKRVVLRDLVFLLEQERETCKTNLVYKSFLK